jgi:prephenate dehydrogenase
VLHDVSLTLDPDAVVTDVGSTKSEVIATARAELRERFPRFVAGHPSPGARRAASSPPRRSFSGARASCSRPLPKPRRMRWSW